MTLVDPAPTESAASALGVFLPAIGILAATASIVVASVSRQENLSNRTRSLAKEYRELLDKEEITEPDRERIVMLPEQIFLFEKRLGHCVRGHLILYFALALEAVGFGVLFADKLLSDISFNQARGVNLAIVGGLVGLAGGIVFHIIEYFSSRDTIELELKDIHKYRDEALRDLNGFLARIRPRRSVNDSGTTNVLHSPTDGVHVPHTPRDASDTHETATSETSSMMN